MYNSAKDLRAAIIKRRRLNKLKKIFLFGSTVFGGYIFINFSPQNEKIQIETSPAVEENIFNPKSTNTAENTAKIADNSPSEIFPPIIYPEDKNAPVPVYERYTPPSNFQAEISNFDAEKMVAEITEKVDALNLSPPPKMPFRDFKNQMRNLNLSETEL